MLVMCHKWKFSQHLSLTKDQYNTTVIKDVSQFDYYNIKVYNTAIPFHVTKQKHDSYIVMCLHNEVICN